MNSKEQKSYDSNKVICISSVGKAFATRLVLDNIDLNVARGQSVCLCGVNGVGKSTLMRIISGLLEPDQGSVRLCGYNLRKDPEKAKPQLGVVSHKSMVYPNLTVRENLCFFANLYGIRDSASRVKELLGDIGLFSYRYDKAGILSRGLLQRLAIARALVHRPVVLLIDEPFTGLDAESRQHLITVLTNFTDNGGTIVMTTHDMNIGIRCCDRVIVLDKTQLIFDAMTCEIDTAGFVQDYLSYARSRN
jgi:heme ABC exporter ATP-binding subunit CcmA